MTNTARDEVVRALEHCISITAWKCWGCPYEEIDEPKSTCSRMMANDVLALLKAERPDCETAYHDAGGCLGYCHSDNDDEPIDACKTCENYTCNREADT